MILPDWFLNPGRPIQVINHLEGAALLHLGHDSELASLKKFKQCEKFHFGASGLLSFTTTRTQVVALQSDNFLHTTTWCTCNGSKAAGTSIIPGSNLGKHAILMGDHLPVQFLSHSPFQKWEGKNYGLRLLWRFVEHDFGVKPFQTIGQNRVTNISMSA